MTIGEMSKRTGLTLSTLRYYERKQLIRVARDRNNRRVYDERDVDWIKFIERLKATGMLLRDIKTYSELRYEGQSTMSVRLSMLESHRRYVLSQLEQWREYLSNLDEKINFYQKSIAEK